MVRAFEGAAQLGLSSLGYIDVSNLGRKNKMRPISIFICFFFFVLIAGGILQLAILPSTPWHAGHGLLMGGDWVAFHEKAFALATQIKIDGWGRWSIRPEGNSPIGIAAAFYAFTGVREPWILLPLNAILYGLAAATLFSLLRSLSKNRNAQLLGLAPMFIFPSTAMIWGQIHKDVWMLSGSLLILLSYLKFTTAKGTFSELLKIVSYNYLGFFLVWLVRPYANKVFFLGGIVAFLAVFVLKIIERENVVRWCKFAFSGIVLSSVPFILTANLQAVSGGQEIEGKTGTVYCEVWKQSPRIPLLDSQLRSIVCSREAFQHGYPEAGSNLDVHAKLTNFKEIIAYIPRAVQIGLFSPFPNMWFEKGYKPGARFMRLVSAFEMSVFYFLLLGFVFLPWRREKRESIILLAIFSVVSMTVYAMVVVNVGTLYRMRYPMMLVLMGLGIWGWSCVLEKRPNPKRV